MKIALVPQWEAAFERSLSAFADEGEYDPRVPGGSDRSFYGELKRQFEADGHEFDLVTEVGVRDADALLFVGFRQGMRFYRRALSRSSRPFLFYIAREPPVYSPYHAARYLVQLRPFFDRIFTWNDRLVEVDGFEKYHWPIPDEHFSLETDDRESDFEDRSLMTMVLSNSTSPHSEELYTERKNVADFYEENHPEAFELYGIGWNEDVTVADICKGIWKKRQYDVYRGEVDDKFSVFRDHRFVLSFENMTGVSGWLSEKPFDALVAERIPVYWGADNVREFLPEETYVDYRDFGSPDRLHEFLTGMTETEYERRLSRVREFMREDGGGARFRKSNVAARLKQSIEDVAARSHTTEVPASLELLESVSASYTEGAVNLPNAVSETTRALIKPPADMSRVQVGTTALEAALDHYVQ